MKDIVTVFIDTSGAGLHKRGYRPVANAAPIKETFFGYYKEDGFYKKKNLGRIERTNCGVGVWKEIEQEWLDLYFNRISKPGFSVVKEVTGNDEWLAEAYMETNYSELQCDDFEKVVRSYLAFLVDNDMVK